MRRQTSYSVLDNQSNANTYGNAETSAARSSTAQRQNVSTTQIATPPSKAKKDTIQNTLRQKSNNHRRSSDGWSFINPGVSSRRSSSHRRFRMALFNLRSSKRIWRSRIRVAFLLFLSLILLDIWQISMFRPLGTRVVADEAFKSNFAHPPKVFIASIHRNNEKILRSSWNGALLRLVEFLGPENVYVSLYESGSIEDTKGALSELDLQLERLGVPRTVELDPMDQIEEVHRLVKEKEKDWIWTSRGRFELRRIPYLANLRNKVMEKLYEQERMGEKYDYVLWINDVVFNNDDVATLLSTNAGKYDSVCGMDYKFPHLYYDTFALRDFHGSKALPNTWPYFTYKPSRTSLIALQPVPVRSCWNGIIAMKSAPFYATPPLRFRGVPDSLADHHLEGSECCLIHSDNNQTTPHHGVWVNPNVRVGYNAEAYEAVNPKEWIWPGAAEKVRGIWMNRLQRLFAWPKRRIEAGVVRKRVEEWSESEMGRGEAEHCLINEMQVLEGAGWRHL